MKPLIIILITIAILYIIYCSIFYAIQRKVLFPVSQLPEGNPKLITQSGGEIVRLPFSEGEFELAYLPATNQTDGPSPVIILAHGNGNIMDSWASSMGYLREKGFAVVLTEYPGYGRSQGTPSYKSIKETMAITYQWVIDNPNLDNQNINLVGRSMGGGAVLSLFDDNLNQDNQPNSLILMSTYSSIADIAADRWLPEALVRDPFDNVKQLAKFKGKTYLIHGEQDTIVPFKSLDKLLAVAHNSTHRVYPGGHNNIPDNWDEFWQEVVNFIRN